MQVKIVELPGLADGEDIEQFDAAIGGTPEDTRAAIERLASETPWMDDTEIVGGLVTRCLADVKAEEVAWAWRGRIALGKLSLIGGIPGVGKSWFSLYFASAVSRGMPWPDGRGNAPLGSVLIANAEDGVADTILPRLQAMGADCRKIHTLDCVKRPGADGKMIEYGFTLADVGHLEDTICRLRDCRTIIIDPVSAHLAYADEHRNGEVRALLKPLAKLAERYGVAIILITHLTKNGGPNSVHRMIGSIAFAGAARSVWMVAKDPKDPKRRLLLLAKCNIAADEGGLAYSIVDNAIAFEPEPVTQSADEVLRAENNAAEDGKPGPEPEARNAAKDWLAKLLANGDMPAATVKTEGKAAGLAWRTVQRAAEALGIIREKNAFKDGWQWRFPKPGTEVAKSVEIK